MFEHMFEHMQHMFEHMFEHMLHMFKQMSFLQHMNCTGVFLSYRGPPHRGFETS